MLPKDETKIVTQTKFMAWESENKLKLVDIDADPPIEKIIRVKLHPDEKFEGLHDSRNWLRKLWDKLTEIPRDHEEEKKWAKEEASTSIPYFDIEPYIVKYI